MKAEELMIGDWVIFLGKYRKVCQIGPDNQVRFYGKNKVIVSADELDTVPLTPEILEKNGFSRNGLDIALFDRKGGDDFVGASNLQYVHDLQHALRLCGIDKEIEL